MHILSILSILSSIPTTLLDHQCSSSSYLPQTLSKITSLPFLIKARQRHQHCEMMPNSPLPDARFPQRWAKIGICVPGKSQNTTFSDSSPFFLSMVTGAPSAAQVVMGSSLQNSHHWATPTRRPVIQAVVGMFPEKQETRTPVPQECLWGACAAVLFSILQGTVRSRESGWHRINHGKFCSPLPRPLPTWSDSLLKDEPWHGLMWTILSCNLEKNQTLAILRRIKL